MTEANLQRQLAAWWMQQRRAFAQRRWQRWYPSRPVQLADGTFSVLGRGQIWRRSSVDGWHYKQDVGFGEHRYPADQPHSG